MSVRTIVLFGALAWVSGSLLVLMNRGVLAEGRVAGISTTAAVAKVPTGDAIVSLTNDKTLYLRRGDRVWRIADPVTLQMLAKQVTAREGRSSLDGFSLVGTVSAQNLGEVMAAPALSVRPQEPVENGDDEGVPAAGPLRLRVDSSTPPPATLPDGTQLNSVLAINIRSLSALPVSVTSLTLTQEYAYLASTSTSTLPTSTTFDGATVWDGASRHGSRGTFGANLRATVDMSADPITIPPLGTKVVMVKADLPAYVPARMGDYGVRLAVSAAGDIVQTGGSAIGAAFPLRGSLFSWVDGSASLGRAEAVGLETSGYATVPSTTTEPNILTGEYPDLFRFQIYESSSREDLEVHSIAVSIEGSVNPATDLRRFQLVAAGGTVATATAAVGRTVTFNLPSNWRIPGGQNRTFSVGADIAGGVGQWFRFSIADPDSLVIRGATTGMYMAPTAAWPLVSEPGYWQVGSQATSSDDVVPVARSTWLSADGTVVNPGEHQAPLGAYVVTNPTDQALRFNGAVLNFDYATSTATGTLSNFALYRVDRASGTAQIVTTYVPQIYGHAINLYPSGEVWLEPGASMDLELRADVAAHAQPGPLLSSSMPAWGIAFSAASGAEYRGPLARVVGQSVVVQVPTLNISSVFSSPEEYSSIILSGSQDRLLQTLRLNAFTEDGHLDLHKITLQFDSSIGGVGDVAGVYNLGTVRLYHDGTLLGTANAYQHGTTTADVAFFFASPVAIPAWAPYDIDVRADFANSGSGADATQIMARIKSNSNSDLDVRSPSGILPPAYVNIGSLQSPSSWFLVHDTAPAIVALPLTGSHVIGATDEIARFEVRNYGQVALRLDELKLNLAAVGLRLSTTSPSAFDRVYDFGLYDGAGTLIANPAAWRMLTATTSTSTLRFSSSTSVNLGWEVNAEIPPEASRVYSLRANTMLINATGLPGTRTLQAQVPGMRGHIDGLEVYESNWAYGGAVYRYTPAGYAEWRGPFSASDSYPVLGTVVSYN